MKRASWILAAVVLVYGCDQPNPTGPAVTEPMAPGQPAFAAGGVEVIQHEIVDFDFLTFNTCHPEVVHFTGRALFRITQQDRGGETTFRAHVNTMDFAGTGEETGARYNLVVGQNVSQDVNSSDGTVSGRVVLTQRIVATKGVSGFHAHLVYEFSFDGTDSELDVKHESVECRP